MANLISFEVRDFLSVRWQLHYQSRREVLSPEDLDLYEWLLKAVAKYNAVVVKDLIREYGNGPECVKKIALLRQEEARIRRLAELEYGLLDMNSEATQGCIEAPQQLSP